MPVPFTPWWLAGGIPKGACVAAYQPLGAKSLRDSYTNLANPGTYDAAPGVAPTFNTATGWTFNGSDQYLETSITAQITWSAFVRFSNVTSSGYQYLFGYYITGVHEFAIFPATSGGVYYSNGAAITVLPALTSGVLGFAGKTAYRNGNVDGSIGAGGWANDTTVKIGGGQATRYIAGKIQAFALYDITLTAPQVAAVSTAMQKGLVSDQYRLAQTINRRKSRYFFLAPVIAAIRNTIIKHGGRNLPG